MACYNAEKSIIKNISLLVKKIKKAKIKNEIINDIVNTDNTYLRLKKIKNK